MKAMIAKMRADWVVVAEDRLACGDWSAEDEAEMGQAIKGAIEAGDPDTIALWARWLADLSALACGLRVVAVTKRMRDQARKQHEGAPA